MCSDDLVDTMWSTTWVMLGAIDVIAKPGDWYAANGMQWGAADDLSTMVCRVTNDDDFKTHIDSLQSICQGGIQARIYN
jgi:hypothetical protein